jgi:hypothetical protein
LAGGARAAPFEGVTLRLSREPRNTGHRNTGTQPESSCDGAKVVSALRYRRAVAFKTRSESRDFQPPVSRKSAARVVIGGGPRFVITEGLQ